MRGQQNQTRGLASKLEKSSKGNEVPQKRDSSSRDLSTLEILELWTGLEVRVVGLFRVSGERSAVAAVTTILGFIFLVFKHFPLGVCLTEGALGAGLVWMLIHKANAKRKN